ncbi:hypothetical protein DSM112329_00885 [Paraconexibacter sp. AEG42_29]|uniref:Mce/MlaD domain-containing protein n=1 Tax=Paraconexibacter sp. AEG42_29 TaxID=2997339 RepID=A0AAU7AQV1_9ACTN
MKKLIPALLAAAVVVVAVIMLRGDDDKYVVYIKAKDAGGVLKNYNIKVGEVAAGKVVDISLDDQDNAVLKAEMDDGAFPIGAGASAAIRPVNLLGEKYIDLDPGDLKQPQPSGTTVQPDKVTVPIELDDALNVLDLDTRTGMKLLINEAGIAMAGRGADFNETLDQLPPALDAAKRVVTEVDQENVKLKSVIATGDRVLATIAPKADDFGDMVKSAADALETAAQRREALGRTVQTAPAALASLRNTLVKLQDASAQISPAAKDLTQAAPDLDTTLKRLPQFAEDASGTLDEIRKTSPALSKLGKRSTPTLRSLRPTLSRLANFATDFQPLLDTLDGKGGTKQLLQFVNGWASTTSQRDGLGHVFRLRTTADSSLITGLLQRGGLGALTGPSPAETNQVPNPPIKRKAAPAKAPEASAPPAAEAPKNPVKKIVDDLDKTVKGATGAVKDVLNGLIGNRQDGTGLLGGLTGGKKSQPQGSGSGSGNEAGKLLNYLLGP